MLTLSLGDLEGRTGSGRNMAGTSDSHQVILATNMGNLGSVKGKYQDLDVQTLS